MRAIRLFVAALVAAATIATVAWASHAQAMPNPDPCIRFPCRCWQC